LPRALRFDQFGFGTPTPGKRPNGFSCGQMCGYLDEFREPGDRAGRNHLKLPLDALGLGAKDARPEIERFGELVEKLGAKAPRFQQCDRSIDEACDHDSRKTGTRSNVDPRGARPRLVADKLRRIGDVPIPDLPERRSGDKILAFGLLAEESDIGVQLLECFT